MFYSIYREQTIKVNVESHDHYSGLQFVQTTRHVIYSVWLATKKLWLRNEDVLQLQCDIDKAICC